MRSSLASLSAFALLVSFTHAAEPIVVSTATTVPFKVQLDVVHEGFDGKRCFVQNRAGIVPRQNEPPIIVMTANPLLLPGSDVYFTVHDFRSDDLGKTWTGPTRHDGLARRSDGVRDGQPVEIGVCDFWPKWHAKSGKLLNIGHTVRYVDDKHPLPNMRRETAYSVYDPESRTWTPWTRLLMPGSDEPYNCGAGCIQRVDLPNGDILLPVYGGQRTPDDPYTHVKVIRCGFDGTTLTLKEEGEPLRQESKRGFAEPSLTRFGGKFYLTIRHDDTGYVAVSDDGLHFSKPTPWCWDDGSSLGNYNTQTHWVTHSDALHLAYTRRGAANHHVFRNRAPIFLGEVDPTTLRVKRESERVLIPERGARFGNFGICEVSENETWVTDSEWMQTWKQTSSSLGVENPYGAKNRIYAARILWDKPNTDWNSR